MPSRLLAPFRRSVLLVLLSYLKPVLDQKAGRSASVREASTCKATR